MTPAEIQVRINIARREMQMWQEILEKKNCKDCKQWMHPGCGAAGGIVPPVEVVKSGCPEWAWDEIPF